MSRMVRDYVTDVNENFAGYWERISEYHPGGASRTFGGVPAISTGTPVPVFNRVYVFEPAPREDISQAISWMLDREVPFRVTIAEPVLAATESIVADLDLVEADDPLPGMALSALDTIPTSDEGIDVELVTETEELETFVGVVSAGFGISVEVVREAYPELILLDEQMQLLVGRVDGEPIATGTLFQQGDVAGVYVITVTEEFRRRGLGEAMTWAVLRAGREVGATVGVLQSSNMGYSVYAQMGFKTVVKYHQFQSA